MPSRQSSSNVWVLLENPLSILLGCRIRILLAELVAQISIFTTETLTLLLERLDVPILLRQLVLQLANLSGTTCLSKLVRIFARSLGVTFVALDFLFEAESVKDHDIGAVEDEGEEEGEAAKIHVALGIELAGLHFHAARAFEHGGAGLDISDAGSLGRVIRTYFWLLLVFASST